MKKNESEKIKSAAVECEQLALSAAIARAYLGGVEGAEESAKEVRDIGARLVRLSWRLYDSAERLREDARAEAEASGTTEAQRARREFASKGRKVAEPYAEAIAQYAYNRVSKYEKGSIPLRDLPGLKMAEVFGSAFSVPYNESDRFGEGVAQILRDLGYNVLPQWDRVEFS